MLPWPVNSWNKYFDKYILGSCFNNQNPYIYANYSFYMPCFFLNSHNMAVFFFCDDFLGYFIYVFECFTCIYVWAPRECLVRVEMRRTLGSLELRLRMVVSCLPCQCWELNPFPLQEQALLIAGPSSSPAWYSWWEKLSDIAKIEHIWQSWLSDQASWLRLYQSTELLHSFKTLFICLHFMYIGVLPTCMSVWSYQIP